MRTLFAINSILISGFASLTLIPELLQRYDWLVPIVDGASPFLIRLQILLGFWLCARECHRVIGFRWIWYVAGVFGVSISMEFLGTTFGLPFGKYSYAPLLGWKIAGKIPILVFAAWFAMAVASYFLGLQMIGPARMHIFRRTTNYWYRTAQRVGFAALLLVIWSFTLAPVMGQLTQCWVWEQPGPLIYQMPIRSLSGWLVTGLLIFGSFEVLRLRDWTHRFDPSWAIKFYLLNLMLPLGLAIAGALWIPVGLTLVGLSACYFYARKRTLK